MHEPADNQQVTQAHPPNSKHQNNLFAWPRIASPSELQSKSKANPHESRGGGGLERVTERPWLT